MGPGEELDVGTGPASPCCSCRQCSRWAAPSPSDLLPCDSSWPPVGILAGARVSLSRKPTAAAFFSHKLLKTSVMGLSVFA